MLTLIPNPKNASGTTRRTLFYGWVIVASCTILQIVQYGVQYSFGVFFKPLTAEFGWSRASTSGAYSVLMISAGISAIPLGWLADKIGPAKVIGIGGLMLGLGLFLTSQVHELWQLYLTYGFIQGFAIGGTVAITGGVTARWFVKKRGLALGIVYSGIGLGTLIMPPVAERLIAIFGWPMAFRIIGITAGIVTIVCSLFLRRGPESMGYRPYGVETTTLKPSMNTTVHSTPTSSETGISLGRAIHTRPLLVLCILFFLINICAQVVLVHIVNFATDIGISAFTAATLVSVIGIGGILGRLIMGTVSDRIGGVNSLIITCSLLTISLIWIIFFRQLWMLYLFAVVFGFAYSGGVPLIPMLVGEFFGLKAVMALTGVTSASTRVGGAAGSWMAGKIYDVTHSYTLAFIITATAALLSLLAAYLLKKAKTEIVQTGVD